jgi:hypothetical protein
MRASTAYFAGVGTVVVAIAVGLGGGLTIANIMSPTPSRPQTTRLDQRMPPQPVASSNQPDGQQAPAPVPYVAASQAAAISAAPQSQQTQAQVKTQAGSQAPQTAAPSAQADKRRADRQQQWAGRRKYDQQREQALRDAQARMQDDDGPRGVVIRRDDYDRRNWRDDRADSDPPARFAFPGFNLFGSEN